MMGCFCIDRQGFIKNNGAQEYHYEKAAIYIDGLIYAYQKKAGKETVDWIYKELIKQGVIPFEEIHGTFSCMIKYGEKAIVFSDNSNMHCIYYSDNHVSNSFMKMIELEKIVGSNLVFDIDALCEYLTLGNLYFNKTFFSNIKVLDSTQYVEIRDNMLIASKKGIGDIDSESQVPSISGYFDNLSYSLADYSICQALTGGYDSRLIYACLSAKMNDHIAITSNDKSNKDVVIATEVAKANGDQLEIIPIPKPQYSDELVSSILEEGDGIQPLDFDSFIRLSTFMHTLSIRYPILLTGDGGVLHKDWEWTQDLPFYRKKRSNPRKFYYQRLCCYDISQQLGEKTYDSYIHQEKRFVDELIKISKSLNTQSYDSWYYRVSGNRKAFYNHTLNSGIIMYAPLMEIDAVRYSYALPRHKRFFYNSMRDIMSSENKKIARIKTNYGTTASNETVYLIHDAFYQFGEYVRKAYRLFGRKILNKNVMVNSHTGWSLEEDVRKSTIAENALHYAVEEGLIEEHIEINKMSFDLLTRIIHIYWLARIIENV